MSEAKDRARRTRIAFLIWNLKPAGAERQLLEVVARLDRNKYEPTVIVFKEGPLDAKCPCPLVSLGASPKTRGGLLVGGLLSIWRLVRVLRRMRTDILHGFLPEMAQVIGAPASKLAGVPAFVCNRRSTVALYRNTRFLRIAEPLALKMTAEMAVNAEALRRELEVLDRYPADQISVIPNGVDTNRFRPGLARRVDELGWADDSIVIGIVANFRACKRHVDFLNAADMVRRTHPQARFLMVGNAGDALPAVQEQIKELGLDEIVRVILGSSSPEEYYGSMDMLVCTSETEGLSNVLLEGMACGLPIVATAVGGNPEAIQDGVQGRLVPVHDPEAVAGAVGQLIADPALRARMGQAGRLRAVEKFSMQAMVSGFEELYERALAHACLKR